SHRSADHSTGGHECVPGFAAEALDVKGWSCRGGPRDTGAQHQPGRCGDRSAHGARTDGRTGDEVWRKQGGAAAPGPAGFAGQKRIELSMAFWVVNDIGLVVEYHFGPGDVTAKINSRDHVERCRRIARRRDNIECREYIGDGFVTLVDRNGRWRAFLRPKSL